VSAKAASAIAHSQLQHTLAAAGACCRWRGTARRHRCRHARAYRGLELRAMPARLRPAAVDGYYHKLIATGDHQLFLARIRAGMCREGAIGGKRYAASPPAALLRLWMLGPLKGAAAEQALAITLLQALRELPV